MIICLKGANIEKNALIVYNANQESRRSHLKA